MAARGAGPSGNRDGGNSRHRPSGAAPDADYADAAELRDSIRRAADGRRGGEAVSDAIGPSAFDEELNHASEHSIELAAVWLHDSLRRAGRENGVSVVPILCGSFHAIATEGADPDDSPAMAAALDILGRLTRERRTLVIAAGDLAHVGPAFGDSIALDAVTKAKVKSQDAESLAAICDGDAARFLDISRNESDRRRICGLPPIYLMLRLLGGASGVQTGYDQCPADTANGSIVSIAGALLYR